MKTVIYYYSFTQKTKLVAETLGKICGAELREIQETKKRNKFNAYFWGCRAALRHQASSIKPVEVNLNNYNPIFIGSPIWAGNAAPALNALLAQINFADKNVILFFTMRGGGGKKAVQYLTKLITAQGGKVLDSIISRSMVKDEVLIKQAEDFGKKYKK